jgi:hypothetical protein
MEKSLFQKNNPEKPTPTPYELIENEIDHLRKGTSVRYGNKARGGTAPWLIIIGFCGLAWLYFMDPICHAWYKGDAVRTYLYLHAYGTGPQSSALVASGILTPDEVKTLNHRDGAYRDYFASPDEANRKAQAIANYMADVALLHAGKYQTLDPVGRMRYLLFIKTGIPIPTSWDFLDPSVGE